MKWVKDLTGRFPERPHYEAAELNQECEALVSSFLKSRHGAVKFPISTDDLTVLVEQYTSDLDMGADLSEEGEDVEGVTLFLSRQKPAVRIDIRLAEESWRENRLRTTLTHEMGHVKFHTFLWAARAQQGTFFGNRDSSPARCFRGTIIGASHVDWMEWQAGYASGAMLMPISPLRKVIADAVSRVGLQAPLGVSSPEAEELLGTVQEAFRVSRDAARVRLAQQGYLADRGPQVGTLPDMSRG